MKTKAYKLAAELGVHEQLVLDWLKAHGYPNVRRADTIRAEVAQAARKAFSAHARRGGMGVLPPMPSPPTPAPAPARTPPAPSANLPRSAPASAAASTPISPPVEAPPPAPLPRSGPLPPRASTRLVTPVRIPSPPGPRSQSVPPARILSEPPARILSEPPARILSTPAPRQSFAEMLVAHLPAGDKAATAPLPDSVRDVARTAAPAGGLRDENQEWMARVARAEAARDEAVRARDDAMAIGLAHAAAAAVAAESASAYAALMERYEHLQRDHERVRMERSQLRQSVHEHDGQRETIEAAFAELQNENKELRAALEGLDRDRKDRQGALEDLQQVMQREVAWRARALELERAHQLGTNLPLLLQSFGLADARQQSEVLRALLDNRDSATGLIRAIRQVDAAMIDKLVNQAVSRVCAHPVCNQVARIDERVAVRVDNGRDCEVCGGLSARRWFARMVRECSVAGVRRLLVIGGGDRIHAQLRDLSQGQPVDLRLVAATEGMQTARVRGRVEGSDLLVLWSDWVVTDDVSGPYSQAAKAEGRPVVTVLGQTPDVVALARAVCNRLARNHVLVAS